MSNTITLDDRNTVSIPDASGMTAAESGGHMIMMYVEAEFARRDLADDLAQANETIRVLRIALAREAAIAIANS